jgi:hypothetical protein
MEPVPHVCFVFTPRFGILSFGVALNMEYCSTRTQDLAGIPSEGCVPKKTEKRQKKDRKNKEKKKRKKIPLLYTCKLR